MALTEDGPSMTATEVEAALQSLGVTPFPAIVDHLSTMNGADGRNSHYVAVPGEEEVDVKHVLGIGFSKGQLSEHYGMMSRFIPEGWVPIAVGSFGNAFVVSPAGGVRFWDHETHRSIPAFDSISTFLSAVQYQAPPAPTGPDYAGMSLTDLAAAVASSDDDAFAAGQAGRTDFVPDLVAHHSNRVHQFTLGACHDDRTATVQALLDEGVDIDIGPPDGWTPLMAAAAGASVGVVDLLLAAGADPTIEVGVHTAAHKTALPSLADKLLDAIDAWNP